ncbi:NAD(P)-binding protein [Ascoidea rubescens DSM 1968]|uniref:NAD(P)-binding protein n=1 Tax=Ascoidea rubescens DSM 1968 TaxID=1344418 RepID=A0A1D2V8X0_9ASCO|nr:NAD(P)-binding protein [Ascoidea rubescens DSM 1968]ODV58102.1 NAD(P)-binding protein [Ascoidea rubescens DSM 1968]
MSADLFSLKGKIALITGATNGIGKGMAIGLAEANIDQIIVVHRPKTDPKATVELLVKSSPRPDDIVVSTIECDLSIDTLKIEEIEEKIVQKAINLSRSNKIDILINNAGISHRSGFLDYPDHKFDNVFFVNFRVPAKLTQLVGKHMIDNKVRGKIIFTASLTTYLGSYENSVYSSTKSALKGFILSISNEWASSGINVNGIAPGWIKTNMTDVLYNNSVENKKRLDRIPAGRWGDPIDDFKGPIVFLSSDASNYVSGEIIVVDGGYLGF